MCTPSGSKRPRASRRDAKTYLDYRALLDDKSIDAVLIATPQHLHCEHFMAALDAGKHVYQEKTMAFTVAHAKKMRAAYQRAGKRTVQIGHQWTSTGQVADAASFLNPELMGKITAIHGHMYRNTPHGKPQWARPVYPDMTAGEYRLEIVPGRGAAAAVRRQPLHQLAVLLGLLGRQRLREHVPPGGLLVQGAGPENPPAVTMNGGLYLWKDGREVPDTMNVSMEQPEEILFSWDSGFGNDKLGMSPRTCWGPTEPSRAASRSATRRRRSTGRKGTK